MAHVPFPDGALPDAATPDPSGASSPESSSPESSSPESSPPELPLPDAQQLIGAIVALAAMADRALPRRTSSLAQRLQEHLSIVDGDVPNTSSTFDPIELANLQLALDDLRTSTPVWDVIGLPADIGNYGGVSLAGLVGDSWHGPGPTAPQYLAVDVSATETIRCLRAGIVLTSIDDVPVATLLYMDQNRGTGLQLEIVAGSQVAADAFLSQIQTSMDEHNVLRGKVLAFTHSEYGPMALGFTTLPAVSRNEVICRRGNWRPSNNMRSA